MAVQILGVPRRVGGLQVLAKLLRDILPRLMRGGGECHRVFTDSECLDPLRKWTSGFNAFDVLGITSSENRHSNVLAWLLSDSHRALADVVVSFI